MSFIGSALGATNSFQAGSPGLSENNPFTQQFNQQAAQAQGAANLGAQGQTAQQQGQLAQMLMQQAQGQGPSVSGQQLQNALQQQQAQTNALMGSARGGVNPALLMRQAQMAQSGAAQQAASQAALGRIQEQQGAQQSLGSVLGQTRGQDIQNALGQQQIAQGYGQMGLSAANDILGSQMQAQQINAGISQANTEGQNKLTGGVISGLAGMGASQLGKGKAHGGYVEGGKVAEEGDSPKNDTVHTMLSPGEIVIPRTKAKDPDKAKEFIDHLMQSKDKGKGEKSYAEVMASHKKLQARVEALEKQLKKKGK